VTEDISRRRAQMVTAALRAGYAWSVRHVEVRAWRELAGMTGVVMYALGPGSGPVTPVELVATLRVPLGSLLPPLPSGETEAVDDLVILKGDELTDAAYEVGCEYTQALFDTGGPAEEWLPPWARQRAEQVERDLFEELIQRGSDEQYAATRRFLIDWPAGAERELVHELNARGAVRVSVYGPVPDDRVFRWGAGWDQRCWWPCPACLWPMRVRGGQVDCSFSPHQARYEIDLRMVHGGRPPRLLRRDSSVSAAPPGPQPAEGTRCVHLAAWRFVVVPGVTEVRLADALAALPGVEARLWPGRDTYDLEVTPPGAPPLTVDVKDHTAAGRIAERPPRADHVVVPWHRRSQVGELSRLLAGKRVWDERRFLGHVRKLAGVRR
jgi:pPIWI_RE three-gene island domain Y/REase associating with pPIWI_RE